MLKYARNMKVCAHNYPGNNRVDPLEIGYVTSRDGFYGNRLLRKLLPLISVYFNVEILIFTFITLRMLVIAIIFN